MKLSKLPMKYKVIESGFGPGESAEKEIEVYGKYGATHFQTALFRIMDHLCDGQYNGGVWDLREYENGAVAWIFPKEGSVLHTHTYNGYDPEAGYEAISIAANLIEMSAMMGALVNGKAADAVVKRLAVNFELLTDVARRHEQWVAIRQIID